MNKLIFVLSLVFSLNSTAQEIVTFVDQMPTFGKKKEDLTLFISNNMQYPEDALMNNIEGKVVVNFVVNEDGSLSYIKILKNLYPSIDEEAIRLVKSMPKWNPGKSHDSAVKVLYTLPLPFKLNIPKIQPIFEWTNANGTVAEENQPKFPGGPDSLNIYFWNNLTYPTIAKESRLETEIPVTFQIDSSGNIINAKAEEKGWEFAQEALRVVQKMPKWIPGQPNTKRGPVLVTIHVRFEFDAVKQ